MPVYIWHAVNGQVLSTDVLTPPSDQSWGHRFYSPTQLFGVLVLPHNDLAVSTKTTSFFLFPSLDALSKHWNIFIYVVSFQRSLKTDWQHLQLVTRISLEFLAKKDIFSVYPPVDGTYGISLHGSISLEGLLVLVLACLFLLFVLFRQTVSQSVTRSRHNSVFLTDGA